MYMFIQRDNEMHVSFDDANQTRVRALYADMCVCVRVCVYVHVDTCIDAT